MVSLETIKNRLPIAVAGEIVVGDEEAALQRTAPPGVETAEPADVANRLPRQERHRGAFQIRKIGAVVVKRLQLAPPGVRRRTLPVWTLATSE